MALITTRLERLNSNLELEYWIIKRELATIHTVEKRAGKPQTNEACF